MDVRSQSLVVDDHVRATRRERRRTDDLLRYVASIEAGAAG
jgi:hypothetical protein